MFARSPSIFSPPLPKVHASPGVVVRADIKATLEDIPPDLFMEMVFDFVQAGDASPSTFVELSSGDRRILLFLHHHLLQAVDVSYVDAYTVGFTVENVQSICRFRDLMFFVVVYDKTVVPHEEDRAIVHLPFTDTTEIHQIGRKYVLFKGEDEVEVFSFELAATTGQTLLTQVCWHDCTRIPCVPTRRRPLALNETHLKQTFP
jgi:hypothetical protein